jgi:AraC family transcriptional regulator, positive regulator of tynA and feaB
VASPVRASRFCSASNFSLRRTGKHIRQGQADNFLIWAVRRGGISFTRSSGTVSATEGEILVHDTASPFLAEFTLGDGAWHESLQAVVPGHLLREYLAGQQSCQSVIGASHGTVALAGNLLEMLVARGASASNALRGKIADCVVEAIGSSVAALVTGPGRVSIMHCWLEQIEAYVMRNLTSSNLSTNAIAEGCNISPRFLSYVLKSSGLNYEKLVWQRRLEKAKEWLASPRMNHCPIHQIAVMAGYKSPAHFSRVFKAECGVTPRAYRHLHLHFPYHPP